MILATHVVIAAAITKPLAGLHPIIPFAAALASHYIADAIPHWHYPTDSIDERDNSEKKVWRRDRAALARDFLRFALDGAAGMAIAFFLTRPDLSGNLLWFAAVVSGSVLPDALQGIYMAGCHFLKSHQIFHDRVHSKIKLDVYPLIGVPFQIVIATIAVILLLGH